MPTDPGARPLAAATGTVPAPRPLVLAPFRALRFRAEAVGDLGTVVSPPYDVLDADIVRDLEAANPRNIVRLILSRQFEGSYRAVDERLQEWRNASYLAIDADPALYLYQYAVGSSTVRGLVGAVALREENERVVLPHENVMPGPVEDRRELMRTTACNLEPILLVRQGGSGLSGHLGQAARGRPLASFRALDGSRHRLWAITDRAAQATIAAELAAGRALIADGHHRYAAYLSLQPEMRDPHDPVGESPWDYGLALLVDEHDQTLTVGPIHRSVAALTMADVSELAADRSDELTVQADREAALDALRLGPADDAASFVISDGRRWAVLRTRRVVETTSAAGRTGTPVDAAVLHDRLFPAWGVTEGQVGYHHSLDQALHQVAQAPGVVVALRPPTLAQVIAAAARGVRMPRKSTSFSPKPRMGIVMRDLRDS